MAVPGAACEGCELPSARPACAAERCGLFPAAGDRALAESGVRQGGLAPYREFLPVKLCL